MVYGPGTTAHEIEYQLAEPVDGLVREVARPDVFCDFHHRFFNKIVIRFNTNAVGAAPALGHRVLAEGGTGEAHVALALNAALKFCVGISAADTGTGVIFRAPIILPQSGTRFHHRASTSTSFGSLFRVIRFTRLTFERTK